ncbi:MAG TPA: polyprenol monophosphomannose synthase [Halococcus sp.]|nr:polyprenol monophosphomannose synthase [Halococcus sp.]
MNDRPSSRGHGVEKNHPSRVESAVRRDEGQTDVTHARERSVSIIIPTYNERENIERVVERCRAALSEYCFEIVVIDDDSPDRTWKIVEDTYAGADSVRIVRRTEESGLATAVSRGFDEATYDFCAVIDADLQHPPEKLPELIAAFDSGVDIVIGSRHIAGGGVENWSLLRRVVSRGAMTIAKLALAQTRGISDPMSGFFAVRREVIDDVTLAPTGYKILLEVLMKCDYDRIVEVPYIFTERERGESKLTAEEYLGFLEHIYDLRRNGHAVHARRVSVSDNQ